MSLFRQWYSQTLNRSDLENNILFNDESLVVTAGPGSGKTNLLTLKVAYVLEKLKNEPRGVACLTFSRKLAKELKSKLLSVGILPERNVFIGTLHSFCLANIVSLYANFHEYKICLPIRIASKQECDDYWVQAKEIAKVSRRKTSDIISFRNTEFLDNRVFQNNSKDEHLVKAYTNAIKHYERLLLDNEVVDFDLIVRASIQLVHKNDYIKQSLAARFKWLFIDEYQDLGYPLHLFTRILSDSSSIKFFVVGDPDQCIFKFQGAKPDYLNEMKNLIETIALKNNYRSAEVICRAANAVLDRENTQVVINKNVHGRVYLIKCSGLFTHQSCVCKDIVNDLTSKGINPGRISILTSYRKYSPNKNNTRPGIYEINKELGDIPVKILSNPFYSDHTAFVSWLQDVADWCSSGFESGEVPFRDLFADWVNLYECDLFPETEIFRLELQKKLLSVIGSLCSEETPLKELFNSLEEHFYPKDFFERLRKYRPDDLAQYNEIKALLKPGSEIKNLTVQEFGIKVLSGKEVTINTLHGSKGSENDIVIIVGANFIDDPSLFFVGITRARFAVFITFSGEDTSCKKIINKLSEDPQTHFITLTPNDQPQLDEMFFTDYNNFIKK